MEELHSKQICGLIVTYNPEIGVFDLVSTLKNQVDYIIIVDNNSEPIILQKLVETINSKNIHIIQNSENYGIAKALNQGVIFAMKKKYEWVVTFDQDSSPYSNIIDILSEVYNLYPAKEKIGAIGTNFPITNSQSYYPISNNEFFHVKDYLITSGCLLSVNAFLSIGGFREDYFIDNVDLEYSLRLKRNGKILLITNKWGMSHKVGDPITETIGGISMVSSNHNNQRRYYMARNHVILSKSYFLIFPYFIIKTNYFFLLSLLKIILVEKDKKSKIMHSFKGIKDGIFHPLAFKNHL